MRAINRKNQSNNADKNSSMKQGSLLQHNFNPAKKSSKQSNPFRFDLSEIDGKYGSKGLDLNASKSNALDEKHLKNKLGRKSSTKRKDGPAKDQSCPRDAV